MIRYSLKCANNHEFDSWFQSANAFDGLRGGGHVTCPVCGNAAVEKGLMAPTLHVGRDPAPAADKPDLSTPQSDLELAFAEMRRQVEANSDYVGVNFVAEARRMHDGDAPERSIWGEAKPEEVKSLVADGVRVAPLPFMPSRKTH